MIKCPQCLQIRDDGDLPCPHCGEVPYGVRNRPSQRIADDAAEPRGEPKKLGFGGMEIDLGDASSSGLDLASDDDALTVPVPRTDATPLAPLKLEPLPGSPPPVHPAFARPAAPAAPTPAEDGDARRLADYGEPGTGPLGAVRYWWHVSMRRSELNRRRAETAETAERLQTERTSRLAELARQAEALHPADGEPRAGFVRAARAAEARRDEEASVSAAVVSEREKRLNDLRSRLEGLKKELAPLVEAAASARRRLDDLKSELRRTESALKRAEIEQRNAAELVAKRREASADPSKAAEERERLLGEVDEIERRGPELRGRIDAARLKIEGLAQPVAAAQAEHDSVERSLAELRRIEGEVKEKAEEAELELEAERARSGERFQAVSRDVENAWAAVGENVLPTVGADGPLAPLARAAAESAEKAEDAEQRLSLLDRALACYDHDVFSKGKTLAIVGGAVALLLLTVVIVLIIS
ncbi:MAG: hypothetical protein M0R80_05635 [Proteobacteria bacterium]|jgi:hypothetical protein|nr:hypothetical protein [Pseudomonadota bacterium]